VAGPADAATAVPDGAWGATQNVPGLVTLDGTTGGQNFSQVNSVGCSSLGNCVAVGYYDSPITGGGVPFTVTEVNGAWGDAQQVPALPSQSGSSIASLADVACAAPGFCAALGNYTDTGAYQHSFVITETGGTWSAPAVLDTSALGTVATMGLQDLSCPAAGECTAIGSYTSSTGGTSTPVTADDSHGAWTLQPLPGVSSLPHSSAVSGAGLAALSCGAPGDCTAGGDYTYGTVEAPFIVSESSGAWGTPQVIPGLAALSTSGNGAEAYPNQVTSVSCPDASDCAVAGLYYPELNGPGIAFTLDEAGGTWGQAEAIGVPSADAANAGSPAVACRASGNCVVAMRAANDEASPYSDVLTAAEHSSGAWTAATAVSGIPPLDEPLLYQLACVPDGDCTLLGGYYANGHMPETLFSATSPDGAAMGSAQQVTTSTNPSDSVSAPALACPGNGRCLATYNTGNAYNSPQVIAEEATSKVALTASEPKATYGAEQSETLTATVTSPEGGTPTGTVTVAGPSGSIPCTITLTGGTGTCTLTAGQLPAGTDTVAASYSGDVAYLPASSATSVTIAQAATVTRLAFTPRSITFTGTAATLDVTGSVSSTAGTPSGRATVRVDGKAVAGCISVAFNGTVSCKGTTAVLAGGKHLVVLAYTGRGDFAASASAPLPLAVAKRGTTTTLALAETRVTYGHESAEKFTVSVSHAGGVYPAGKVAVRTGGTTICAITLSKGTGLCALANTRLRAGTYTFVALYSGDGNYNQSTSAKKTLKVAA
jgi:hypothetical protein